MSGPTLQEAMALHKQGRLDEAQAMYERILESSPANADCLHLLGVMASQRGDHARAVALMGRALEADPRNAACHYNRALAFHACHEPAGALAEFDAALALNPDQAGAWSSRGVVLQEMRRFAAALESCDRALALQPQLPEAHFNRGNALHALERFDEAIESYEEAVALDPGAAKAWFNLGLALRSAKRLEEAVEAFEEARALQPQLEFLAGVLLLTRMDLCDWEGFDPGVAEIVGGVERGERVVHPFALLAMVDSPPLQRRAAEILSAKYPRAASMPRPAPSKDRRIRVGYFSGDFGEHPVSYLTAELFETHDRAAFEVTGFSVAASRRGAMRARLERAFERFIDASTLSDTEVAAHARELGLDIAVDLGGHTKDARTRIFAARAAPVQASYVGYLGTMGAECYDYLFADEILVPGRLRAHYSERIAYLPSYQANDSKREISPRRFTRAELGLPASGAVFCCLSNAYKITPATFARWMRILAAAKGSVLMLLADARAAENLRDEARRASVDPARLVFAERLPRPEYLARFRSCDLFLDTHPYNAGTVASDALWAGLPVLALLGESFAARMAASLLHAIGLPELVAASEREYEEKAVALVSDARALSQVREKLERNRLSHPLFDTRAFTRHLEDAYRRMVTEGS